jgi:hypothetical protein
MMSTRVFVSVLFISGAFGHFLDKRIDKKMEKEKANKKQKKCKLCVGCEYEYDCENSVDRVCES